MKAEQRVNTRHIKTILDFENGKMKVAIDAYNDVYTIERLGAAGEIEFREDEIDGLIEHLNSVRDRYRA